MGKYGRDPDHLKILPGLSVIVARDEQEAQRGLRIPAVPDPSDRRSRNPVDHARRRGSPPYSLDEPLPDLPPTNGSRGHYDCIVAMARREKLTIRQLGKRVAGARGKNVFVGTPAQVADYMEEWFVRTPATASP